MRRNRGATPTGRRQGDRKVDTFYHAKSGVTCEILLRGVTFYAVLLERQFEAPDANILKADLADYAEHWVTLEWFPVINVEIEEKGRGYYNREPDGEGVQLKMNRFWLSISPAGRSFQVDWDVDEDHRKAEMESYLMNRRSHGEHGNKLLLIGLPLRAPVLTEDRGYLMDYTEEVWMNLNSIMEGIRQLRLRLQELVSTKKGIQQLLTGGSLLGAPPPAAKPLKLYEDTGGIRVRTRGEQS